MPEDIGEPVRAAMIFKFFASEALRCGGEKLPSVRPGVGVEMVRQPVGVVGLIAPCNFSIAIRPGRSPRRWPTAIAWS